MLVAVASDQQRTVVFVQLVQYLSQARQHTITMERELGLGRIGRFRCSLGLATTAASFRSSLHPLAIAQHAGEPRSQRSSFGRSSATGAFGVHPRLLHEIVGIGLAHREPTRERVQPPQVLRPEGGGGRAGRIVCLGPSHRRFERPLPPTSEVSPEIVATRRTPRNRCDPDRAPSGDRVTSTTAGICPVVMVPLRWSAWCLTPLLALSCFDPERAKRQPLDDGDDDGSESGDDAADDDDDGADVDDGMTGNDSSPDDDSASDAGSESDDGSEACGEIVCAHGACINDAVCECDPGWEGTACDVNVDDCADEPCANGTCHDALEGFTCECDDAFEGALCDELAMPFCLVGTLTVEDALDDVNGDPSTMAFEHLEGVATDFRLVFDVSNSFTQVNADPYVGPEGQLRVLDIDVLEFGFSDPFMQDTFGAAFVGMPYDDLVLVNGATVGVSLGNFVSPTDDEYWGWETYATALPIVVDETGFPALLPSTGAGAGMLALRRYQTGDPLMTDYATSSWTLELKNGVACDP